MLISDHKTTKLAFNNTKTKSSVEWIKFILRRITFMLRRLHNPLLFSLELFKWKMSF